MLNNNELVAKALIRNDFSSFLHKAFYTINPGSSYASNWHLDYIAEYLKAIENGEIKRLVINMPPRSLKSICVSVAWPAWLLAHNPACRILAASYSQRLSLKHSLDTRFLLESRWYQNLFPHTKLSKAQNQKNKFQTTQHGFRYATSVGGAVTGEGGDYLIIDDPHNPCHIHSAAKRQRTIDWFEQSFSSRLNDKSKGAMILVMQRLHAADLSGYLAEHKNNWQFLKLPAINEKRSIIFNGFSKELHNGELLNAKRDDKESLLSLEQEMGSLNFAAQYQQEPLNKQHSLVNEDDFNSYSQIPDNIEQIIISFDTAIKIAGHNDFSVGTVWAIVKNNYYLLELKQKKVEYPELKKMIIELYEKYLPHYLLIEDKASGQQIIQDLKYETDYNIIAIKPKLDKITRFASCLPIIESGRIFLPKNASRKDFIDELMAFPASKHDDIVDSFSQFINFIKTKKPASQVKIRNF